MVNEYHIIACGWATREDLDTISEYTFKINAFLKERNMSKVDFIKTAYELIKTHGTH